MNNPDDYQGKHEAPIAPAAAAEERAAEADAQTGTPPGISPRTRSTIYIVCLAVEVATLLICGFGVIFALMSAEQALQIGGLITGAIGLLSTGLAVGYRPTRPGAIT